MENQRGIYLASEAAVADAQAIAAQTRLAAESNLDGASPS